MRPHNGKELSILTESRHQCVLPRLQKSKETPLLVPIRLSTKPTPTNAVPIHHHSHRKKREKKGCYKSLLACKSILRCIPYIYSGELNPKPIKRRQLLQASPLCFFLASSNSFCWSSNSCSIVMPLSSNLLPLFSRTLCVSL